MKSFRRHHSCLHPALGAHKKRLMPAFPEFPRHGKQWNHMAAGSASRHQEHFPRHSNRHPGSVHLLHPACSETFIRMPSDASELTSELPPELIMGSGMPLVGIMPSTTLMFMNPCTTSMVVMPSARYLPKSSGTSTVARRPRHKITMKPTRTPTEPIRPSSSLTTA